MKTKTKDTVMTYLKEKVDSDLKKNEKNLKLHLHHQERKANLENMKQQIGGLPISNDIKIYLTDNLNNELSKLNKKKLLKDLQEENQYLISLSNSV